MKEGQSRAGGAPSATVFAGAAAGAAEKPLAEMLSALAASGGAHEASAVGVADVDGTIVDEGVGVGVALNWATSVAVTMNELGLVLPL